VWSYTFTPPICLHGAQLKHRDIYKCMLYIPILHPTDLSMIRLPYMIYTFVFALYTGSGMQYERETQYVIMMSTEINIMFKFS
jgi:hypothetical protein